LPRPALIGAGWREFFTAIDGLGYFILFNRARSPPEALSGDLAGRLGSGSTPW